ncbi:MAG TPA: hypothetical protein VF939_21950 [Puia sp.]
MSKIKSSNLILIKVVLWGVLFFSTEALVYYVRWFVPFLRDKMAYVVPVGKIPFLWFVVQICDNIIFVLVGLLLLKLFRKYQKTGFFDKGSLKVFDGVILSCIALALLGAVQTIANNFYEVHFNQWISFESIANLLLRSFTRLIILREPQTMYFLLAIILWAVKQFVTKALLIKNENEAFV